MKIMHFIFAVLLAGAAICSAEDPALSVYQIIREEFGSASELMMKVRNPPGQTYYVLGFNMSDVPYVLEIEKNGKWLPTPRPHAITEARMRPFLPDSYLVFNIPIPLDREDITFRVRIFLYTSPGRPYERPGSPANPAFECVSGPFSTKDFRSLRPLTTPCPVEEGLNRKAATE